MEEEKENQELKNLFESLKEILIKKGLLKEKEVSVEEALPVKEVSEQILLEEKEKPAIPEKSIERRCFPRLNLTRNYNRTIILRIESPDKFKNTKSFTNNISSGGLCFDSKKPFKKNSKINLRLFFYGSRIPMMKIKARLVWKNTVNAANYYGVSFYSIEAKDKETLDSYIRSEIDKGLKE